MFNTILKESPLSTLKEKDLDDSEIGYGPVLTVPKIMRRTANLKQNQSIGDLDVNYPPIAMIRTPDGETKPFRPHEFHHLISERLQEAHIVQPFIFSRGNQGSDPSRNTMVINYASDRQNAYSVYRKHVSDELQDHTKKPVRVTCFNQNLNSQLEKHAQTLINFIQYTNKIVIHYANFKFIEDINGDQYFTGIHGPLFYLPKEGYELGQVENNFEAMSIPKSEPQTVKQHRTMACGYPQKICYGDYCDYILDENDKFSNQPISSSTLNEREKTFLLIPKRNKVFQHDFNYTISGNLIKRVQDNPQVSIRVIFKHRIFKSKDVNYNKNKDYMFPDDDMNKGDDESQEMMDLSFDSGNQPFEVKYDMSLFTKRAFINHT